MKATTLTAALPLPHPRRSLWSRLWAARDLHLSRQGLLALEPHLLADIGVTEAEAAAEAARPVWDAPDHWHRG